MHINGIRHLHGTGRRRLANHNLGRITPKPPLAGDSHRTPEIAVRRGPDSKYAGVRAPRPAGSIIPPAAPPRRRAMNKTLTAFGSVGSSTDSFARGRRAGHAHCHFRGCGDCSPQRSPVFARQRPTPTPLMTKSAPAALALRGGAIAVARGRQSLRSAERRTFTHSGAAHGRTSRARAEPSRSSLPRGMACSGHCPRDNPSNGGFRVLWAAPARQVY